MIPAGLVVDFAQIGGSLAERTKHLEFLRETAREAVWTGDFDRALLLLEEGLVLSRRWKLRESEDIFICNRIAMLLEIGRHDFELASLKEALLRHPEGSFGAFVAYTAARAHELRREYEKAKSYAQMAISRCRKPTDYLQYIEASSLNLLGNVSVAEGIFDRALPLYEQALAGYTDCGRDTARETAITEDNVGYIYISRDEVDRGLVLVDRSLTQLDALGARQATVYPCLDQCLAHLKLSRFDDAERWGLRALALGDEFSHRDAVKNSHCLLGEIYSETDRLDEADVHFDALATYYPEVPGLKSFLRQVNVVGMINLRA